jgi:hypothetical protein
VSEPVIVRPSLSTFNSKLPKSAWLVLPLSALLVLGLAVGHGGIGWAWALAVVGSAWVAALAYLLLTFQNAALVLSDNDLTVVNWLGMQRRYPATTLGGVLRRSIWYPGMGRPIPRYFVIASSGRAAAVLDERLWDASELGHLWQRLGIHPEGRADTFVTAKDLSAEYPGLISSWQLHPYRVGLVAGFIVVAGGAAAIFIIASR